MADKTTSAKWARWQWSKGLGRAHRLFHDGDLTKTACQTPRKDAKHAAVTTYAAKPASGPICSTCQLFDQLHEKLVNTTDVIATTTVETTVPAEPVPAGTTEPALPASVSCGCGCIRSDAFVAWKAEHDAWLDAEKVRKNAEFEAMLASKGTVAA